MTHSLSPRLDPFQAAPDTINAVIELENHIRGSSLDNTLIELVKIRASQINGCAFCLHMHTSDARKSGETEDRLNLLAAWHESPLFTARERAALAWTEGLTLLARTQAPQADYDLLSEHFSPREQVELTVLIGLINLWNRLAVGFRKVHPVD